MKTFAYNFMAFFACVGILFGLYKTHWAPQPKKDPQLARQNFNVHYPGVLRFRYADLPEGILARSGDLVFKSSELKGAGYESLEKESQEVLFALAYKQWLSTGDVAEVQLHRPAFSRSVDNILNQYGVPKNPNIKVVFSDSKDSEFYLSVGDLSYRTAEINKDQLLWNSIQSRIFRRKLKLAEEGLKNKALVASAKAEGQNLQEYLAEKVFLGKDYSGEEQKKRTDYFLEKYLLSMPIEISMRPPEIQLDLKKEWTPSLGPTQPLLVVNLFADFYSAGSKALLEGLPKLAEHFPQVGFHFRPFFPKSDRYQLMIGEMSICHWTQDPENFWSSVLGFTEAKGDDFESLLFEALDVETEKKSAIKRCYLGRDHKEVIAYHRQTGDYWGVMSLPTVLVGGEAFVGPTTVETLKEAIGRHLEVPTAAVWEP